MFAGNFMRVPSHMTPSYFQLVCLVSQPDCDFLISQMGPRGLGRLGLLQVTQQVVAEAGPPSKTPDPGLPGLHDREPQVLSTEEASSAFWSVTAVDPTSPFCCCCILYILPLLAKCES